MKDVDRPVALRALVARKRLPASALLFEDDVRHRIGGRRIEEQRELTARRLLVCAQDRGAVSQREARRLEAGVARTAGHHVVLPGPREPPVSVVVGPFHAVAIRRREPSGEALVVGERDDVDGLRRTELLPVDARGFALRSVVLDGEGLLAHVHLAVAALVELPREEVGRVDLVVDELGLRGRSLSQRDA